MAMVEFVPCIFLQQKERSVFILDHGPFNGPFRTALDVAIIPEAVKINAPLFKKPVGELPGLRFTRPEIR